MLSTHRTGRRLAVLTGLCLALGLASVAPAAAYPITPEGEPLHLEGAPQSSVTSGGGSLPRAAGTQQSLAPVPVSETVLASSGTDWGSVIAVAAAAGLAALAVMGGAFALTNHRRRSASAN
jgi:hypothetical protein